MSSKIGKAVGSYMIEKPIGKGQFGEVYLAKSQKDGSLFAIKCIEKEVIQLYLR